MSAIEPTVWAIAAAWGAAAALATRERRGLGSVLPLAALAALAVVVAGTPWPGAHLAPLAAGLAIAALARDPGHALQSEAAIKMLWVLGVALALSLVGERLLVLATSTERVAEQYVVLSFGLSPRFAWSTALVLTLLAGVVLLGAAPFHAWVADLLQGARAWNGPLAAAALQSAGAMWLLHRLDHVGRFSEAWRLADGLLGWAAAIGLLAGAAALLGQRRPERRVGTFASLNASVVLATLAALPGAPGAEAWLAGWAAHLAVAMAGAATLSRFLPVPSSPGPAATLFRRHPIEGALGLLALLSLAAVPGTPGSMLWLAAARRLEAANEHGLLLALAIAWFAAFATAMEQVRDAFGVRVEGPAGNPVPRSARVSLAIAAAGLVTLGVAWFRDGVPMP
jgi:NADH-quinone oxidoreductase subunit N